MNTHDSLKRATSQRNQKRLKNMHAQMLQSIFHQTSTALAKIRPCKNTGPFTKSNLESGKQQNGAYGNIAGFLPLRVGKRYDRRRRNRVAKKLNRDERMLCCVKPSHLATMSRCRQSQRLY
ncbi:hypothetical protein TNCT_350531 [Trichonephila clavata]|uniref:Uncharacterized protein n=1 Tax=Trichonephila clavata TaxID=2740835 RepID=A0A8X6FV38_TRICU|nr:hypothetical protein TNCT_350531 [Trichonephila clavata]